VFVKVRNGAYECCPTSKLLPHFLVQNCNTLEQIEKGNVFVEDLTNENITEFYSSTYESSKSNDMFARLNQLINVSIPMAICSGDNKLTRNDGKSIAMIDYFKEYTAVIEALVLLLFYKQLDYLSGVTRNKYKTGSDPHDNNHSNDDEATSDANSCTPGPVASEKRKKGGRPSGKEGFCHILHSRLKIGVYERRKEKHCWYGWYKEALQSINQINKDWFEERVQGSEIERSGTMVDNQQQGDDVVPPALSSVRRMQALSIEREHLKREIEEFVSSHPDTKKKSRLSVSEEAKQLQPDLDLTAAAAMNGDDSDDEDTFNQAIEHVGLVEKV
jgi:hypothetical protein